jgi:O-antigen/teichoic acid export membrane protein
MLQNLIVFLRNRSSDFVLGRIAGPASLGIFSVASEISNMPGTELVAPINRAILPAYMSLANDLSALRREFLSVMAVVALVGIPAVAGLAVCAPFLVLLALGPKWIQAADLLEILAFYGVTAVMQSNAYSAFLALGKPEVFLRITSIHVVILVALLIAFTSWNGLHGAAWAYVVSSAAIMPVDFFLITRHMKLPPATYIARLWRPLCAAVFMYVGVRRLGPPLPSTEALSALDSARSLAICIAIGVPVYVAAVAILWLLSGLPEATAERWLFTKLKTSRVRNHSRRAT